MVFNIQKKAYYEELEIILLLTMYKSINSKSEDENYKSNLLTKESIFLKEIIEKFSLVKVNDERISYLFKVFKGAKILSILLKIKKN